MNEPRTRNEQQALLKARTDYHLEQWRTPKRSTAAFADFIAAQLRTAKNVVDMGCGAGAATASLAHLFPLVRFTGIDHNAGLIASASDHAQGMPNLGFECGDWLALQPREGVDAVVSMQTLSWLPAFEPALLKIFEGFAPDWIAASSLFYSGEISCRTEVTEHLDGRQSFYNVYALPEVARFCRLHGYELVRAQPFVIDIDLPKPPSPHALGTWTTRTLDDSGRPGDRLQISGPLLMNWQFILIQKARAASGA